MRMQLGRKTHRIYQLRFNVNSIDADVKKEITFKTVVSAEHFFRKHIGKFSTVNTRNFKVVEKCLNWGIDNKKLVLSAAS